MKAAALLTAALLLMSVIPARSSNITPISVMVVTNTSSQTYSTFVVYRGILLGGLTRLQASNQGFSFFYIEHPDYGPFLQRVNGLDGSSKDRTYWELLVKKPDSSTIRPNVGIGCYTPDANDQIILRYSRYN